MDRLDFLLALSDFNLDDLTIEAVDDALFEPEMRPPMLKWLKESGERDGDLIWAKAIEIMNEMD